MTPQEDIAPVVTLGEQFGALRLSSPEHQRALTASLRAHGQLTALVVFPASDGRREWVDGFKRLRAARTLGWTALRVQTLDGDAIAALAAVAALNAGHGLTDLEQAWLCRALFKEHGLTQQAIGVLLQRHKSWVCRRLLRVEGLAESVQADVRLGLIAARSAVEIARLSRDNQGDAARLVTQRGLTAGQTLRMVQALLALPDATTRAQWLRDALDRSEILLRPATTPRRDKTPAEWMVSDIEAATRVATRLQVRLREHPLNTFDPYVTTLLREAVTALQGVVTHLAQTLMRTLDGKDLRDAHVA